MHQRFTLPTARGLRLLLAAIVAAMVAACATMGRPEGGPRDTDPPVYVRSNPRPGQLRFDGNKITVTFDENVALEDAMSKVVVSPAQRTTPAVSAQGRNITVELRDSLRANTTYTIDFADAIKDLNEGNILDGMALDFSTGDTIDTLRISGMVMEARTLEPAQGMLVGVYGNLSDTAITTLPLERITKTNQLGQFTIRNLKEGTYRIYAVNDVNRDYHWDPSEDVAFYDVTLSPSAHPHTFSDTLVSQAGEDSIVAREGTMYLPNDVLLTWFNEGSKTQYLSAHERPEPNQIYLEFGVKADSLPSLRLANTARAGEEISEWAELQASVTLDSLRYWITDSALMAADTLLVEATYYRTDTLGMLSLTTDTLRMVDRGAKARAKRLEKELKEAAEKAKRTRERYEKKRDKLIADNPEGLDSLLAELARDTIVEPKRRVLDFRVKSGTSQELNRPLTFAASTPVASIDSAGVRMIMTIDSVEYPAASPRLRRATVYNPLEFVADYEWEPGREYKLTIDSGAVRDVYGLVNDRIEHKLTTKNLADYGTLSFNLTGLDGRPGVVEVLDGQDKVVATARTTGNSAVVEYLNPATYYARLFIDTDSDGVYTTGILDSIQPEEVYYYPKKINLKKNWSIEQNWNLYELPVDRQKPQEIKKNKPKRKRGETDERTDGDEEEEDEFFDDPFMNAATRRGGYGGNSAEDFRQRTR